MLVMVTWGEAVIAVRRLRSGAVIVGAGERSIARIPEADLGAPEWTIATVDGRGAMIHPPPNAGGEAVPRSLRIGDVARIDLGRFALRIEALGRDDVRPLPRSRSAWGVLGYVALAAVVHGGLLGWARAAPPASTGDESSQGETMKGTLLAAERRVSAVSDTTHDGAGLSEGKLTDGHPGDGSRAGGARAAAQEGSTGVPLSRAFGKRFAAPARNAVPAPAREAGDGDFTATMVGLITSSARAPVTLFGAELASLDDPLSAVGSMWATSLGEANGLAGLGLSGTGEGGGGEGEGIGLGVIGTIGHGTGLAGTGTGGAGAPFFARFGSHQYRAGYRCYGCGASVSGRLPPEAIQRIIRQNMGRVRMCYQAALISNPALSGRVTTRFVIGRDGSVSSVQTAESTIGHAGVDECVARAFSSMSFPQPEGGIVTVSYPILMSPDP